MENIQMAGGWSAYTTDINEQAQHVFDETVGGLRGVVYTPIAVSQQVVAGMNYRFICNAQTVVPESPVRTVIIQIFAPLPGQGEPHITHITDL